MYYYSIWCSNIFKCFNVSQGGAKIKDLKENLLNFKRDNDKVTINKIIISVGTSAETVLPGIPGIPVRSATGIDIPIPLIFNSSLNLIP